jgi:uncharacterized protein
MQPTNEQLKKRIYEILQKASLPLLPFIIGIPIIIITLMAIIFGVAELENILPIGGEINTTNNLAAQNQDGLNSNYALVTNNSLDNDQPTVTAEIADSSEERAQGLMNRKFLAINGGMLFVFPELETVKFWMKNTYVALDMVFINEQYQIVDIAANAEPLNESKTYGPESAIKYVLEVNAGFVEQNNYSIGDKLSINFQQ